MNKGKMYKVSGVTLLEIMLVLAVSSMIIVMSVRYYQSASASQQATAAAELVTMGIAIMDSLGPTGYAGITGTVFQNAMGGVSAVKTPTGGRLEVIKTTATTYTMVAPLNPAICEMVAAKFKTNLKITKADCANGPTMTLEYDLTK